MQYTKTKPDSNMFKQLASASRRRRAGPSLKHFKRTSKLPKHRRTLNSAFEAVQSTSKHEATRAFSRLKKCVTKCNTVVETTRYTHPITHAKYIRYVVQHGKHQFHDDVEVALHQKTIAIRSSSREGVYDMGVNRKRVNMVVNCARVT